MTLFFNCFFIYLIVWWTVLFAILPLGTTSYAEVGIKVTDGGDPGAPVDPKLKKKVITTTWVSAIVFGIGYTVWALHLIPLPNLPSG